MININKSYFHSLTPLYGTSKKNKSTLESTLARLSLILESGYLYPGIKLAKLFKDKYPEYQFTSQYNCIYLAQSPNTELPSLGNSFRNGEFSAFLEHIQGNPSLVFEEEVTKDKNVKAIDHFLSEEICIQDKISIEEIIAIALPYKTPIDEVSYFIDFFESDNVFIDELKDKLISRILLLLNSKKGKISSSYETISKWQTILDRYNLKVPLIRYNGTVFCRSEELLYLNEHEDKVKEIIKTYKK